MASTRHGNVLIDVPQSLGASYTLPMSGVNFGRFVSISVAPSSINNVTYAKVCPPPAISPCAPNPLNPPYPPLQVGGTLGAAPSSCAPPQQLNCILPCQAYTSNPAFCPYPTYGNCAPDPGSIGTTIGCAIYSPQIGFTGCSYPPAAPPSATIQADSSLILGRTPSIIVNPTQIATGSIAVQGNCDLPASVYAPKGPTADNSFII